MKVVIMRSGPGGGKSTYVKENFPSAVVCSADDFFVKLGGGTYKYVRQLIGKAHNECQATFKDALNRASPLIVVDNTNIKVRDFSGYVTEARKHGYDVEIVRLECDPMVAAKRCVHSVPEDIVLRMHKDLSESKLPDDFPAEKVVRTDDTQRNRDSAGTVAA